MTHYLVILPNGLYLRGDYETSRQDNATRYDSQHDAMVALRDYFTANPSASGQDWQIIREVTYNDK